ncbi:hypothetical protein M1O51_04085, partial [Dehalococcoidia bacterium]|nr:hypothetical protein [Dehalococcoidia bacterium]
YSKRSEGENTSPEAKRKGKPKGIVSFQFINSPNLILYLPLAILVLISLKTGVKYFVQALIKGSQMSVYIASTGPLPLL